MVIGTEGYDDPAVERHSSRLRIMTGESWGEASSPYFFLRPWVNVAGISTTVGLIPLLLALFASSLVCSPHSFVRSFKQNVREERNSRTTQGTEFFWEKKTNSMQK